MAVTWRKQKRETGLAAGFDVKIIKKVIAIRKQDHDERTEQEAILDTYLSALGMQGDFFEDKT